jgi:hypothetical protein
MDINADTAEVSWVDEHIKEPLMAKTELAQALYNEKIGNTLDDKLEQMEDGPLKACITGVMQLVGVSAVTIVVLIFVISAIFDAMPTPSNADLANTSTTVIETTSSAFNLGTVALIIIVAGAILYYVGRFGQGGTGGAR